MKFTNLVWMIADQNFYDICFTFFILRLRLRSTAEGRSFSGPNIRLRPKVKIAPTVQHWQNKFDLKLSVYSLGVDIWLLSFKFYFGLIGWPPQPPRERVLKINKIVGFWWSISHWETKIGLFGAMVDGNIKLSNLFCEMRLSRSLRPLRLLRLLRSLRPQIF